MGYEKSDRQELNYRALYGKLFSGLLQLFGTMYVSEIEDAIQNALLKFLKIHQVNAPDNPENWLYIVARNDVLNQVKKQKAKCTLSGKQPEDTFSIVPETDLRLQTILFVAGLNTLSNQARIIFVLKNIFGLSIIEISDSTLLGQEAIYKSTNRTKKSIQLAFNGNSVDLNTKIVNQKAIAITEEILYAVFNIGFDSFSEKTESIVNEDVCLEAIALTKLLFTQYQYVSTSNLLALCCFHTARIPAKVEQGKLVPFFHQDRAKWNVDLVNLGFHYLKKPEKLDRFYLEAIIISRYMSVPYFTPHDWAGIVRLYEMMLTISGSPIVTLNYCFCLSKIGEIEKALTILSTIEKKLPDEHIYFSLVKANILQETNPSTADNLFRTVLGKMNQHIRKAHLLEHALIHL
ncbi:DUF6596 domain-containing protein [Parasegetibacter sp. NRK P23]|uniref:DUF6596 domain-containing protein n=1 Tax=Parasegetibacter sp. NRK P23 TaxID=2942999 RepID=UPI002043ECED|nr:DUF6596 domain-containing protein [Parasegetibacter sp. NRK P23]MCM5528222.1 hypothetical protein [Parasegetibacter sp. NRK P23]